MKRFALFLMALSYTIFPLLGWELQPEFSLEGVLQMAERQRMTRYPDGKEEKWIERRPVLVADEPIILSRSILIANQRSLVQQESIPFIHVLLEEEFESLMGKRVELQGHLIKPTDFFLSSDIQFEVNTAFDVEWQKTHQTNIVLYEPNVIKLEGTLFQRLYSGSPERTSRGEGNTSETAFVLALNEPVDVQSSSEEGDDSYPTEKGVREVEVIFPDSRPPEKFWDRGMIVKGVLFPAHTAYHHRRVLMMAEDWSVADSSDTSAAVTQ